MITKDTKKVLVVMTRYNPQLGAYCEIRHADVKSIRKNTVIVSIDGGSSYHIKYDLKGYDKNPREALYGSSDYHCYTIDEAKAKFDGEKFNGIRISYGKEVIANI